MQKHRSWDALGPNILTQVARYRALRNHRGGYRPPGPPNKSAFGLQSGRAIARPLAHYRALQLEGLPPPPNPPQVMRGLRPLKLPRRPLKPPLETPEPEPAGTGNETEPAELEPADLRTETNRTEPGAPCCMCHT